VDSSPNTFAAYVLAIESIPERIADAKALMASLESLDLMQEIALVPAIYWKNEASIFNYLNRYPEHTFNRACLGAIKVGQLAVTLSHISIWRRLLEQGHKGAVVFEDDIFISNVPRFVETINELKKRPDLEWVRIHLHKKFRTQIHPRKTLLDRILRRPGNNTFIDDPMPYGFAAYYVSRSGAEKLLRFARNIENPVDWFPPLMKKHGFLDSKAVTEVVVEHHAFDGDKKDLRNRHKNEKTPQKLQKTASTIWTSPSIADRAELYRFISMLKNVNELKQSGFTVLRGVFSKQTVAEARQKVLTNRYLFKNTRPSPSAGHLASFHRFPALEDLHTLLTGNPVIQDCLKRALNGRDIRSIGLSDITINRSQPWHKDLLREKYESYLDGSLSWETDGAEVYKVLFYLQDGKSLRIIEGSHLEPIALDDDRKAEPQNADKVISVGVESGDIVIMDIRCSHAGADESVYASGKWDHEPYMVVSTAMGVVNGKLTQAMESGNFRRLMDWMERNP